MGIRIRIHEVKNLNWATFQRLAVLLHVHVWIVEQNEGSLSFRQAWVHHSDTSPIKHEAERLPPPVVADLNGDGHNEVVVALVDKLQVTLRGTSNLHVYGKPYVQ